MSQATAKRKTANRNSTVSANNFNTTGRKTAKQAKIVRVIPDIPPIRGMACTKPGYIRYLNELKYHLSSVLHDGRRINVRFLEYSDSLNIGVVANTAAQILNTNPMLKFKNNGSNIPKMATNVGGIHYFLVSLTKRETPLAGHALNVLMDARRDRPRIWVFDPHGKSSMESWAVGTMFRNRVLPNMRKFFGTTFDNVTAKYYNGPNLQAANTHGVCTTFHLNFAKEIPGLLNGTFNVNEFSDININMPTRAAFLTNPGFIKNVTNKRVTKKDMKSPPKLKMTMGTSTRVRRLK
tara:strand:+ start:3243 stop:4121 length:879 start_codon:yes stop_codon:yes gene_type:complete